KGHVGAAHGAHLLEAGAIPLRRFNETAMEHAHCAGGQAEEQGRAILGVKIEKSARQTGAARHVVHGQCIQAHLASGGFGGIDNFGAAPLLLFESAFGDINHGGGACLRADAVSISRDVCKRTSRRKCELVAFTSDASLTILRRVNPALSTSDSVPTGSLALAELRRGQSAVVTGLIDTAAIDTGRGSGDSLIARLRDIGFVPGARCGVVARVWLGGDPLAGRNRRPAFS